ncbi:MAG: GNAT family N-acetyltransferase [Bacilli bacterium]|nr:GNAT family N-acetyltransferase [Bacilli bacterium]
MSINQIRKLSLDDVLNYKSIRLELLQNEPMNFGSSFEEENAFSNQMWIDRLTKKYIHPIGAFDGEELIGIVLLVCNPRAKMKHVATINSMYVKAKYRGQGIANELLQTAIITAREEHVEKLNLSVVSTNVFAYQLYKRHGFTEYGEEKNAIQYEGQYAHLLLMSKTL